jgi:L-fuculose-phosphate aldolase
MIDNATFEIFRDIGRDIFLRGLISSHAGNMSIRRGDRFLITRRASMLGRLSPEDIVEIDLATNDSHLLMASSEVVVHKAIYSNTSALSIVHTHPPYATLMSMTEDEIIPADSEGSYLFKKVPVVALEKTIGSEDSARAVSRYLSDYRIVLMRGHGSFARGDMLEEAFMFTTSLEASCFFLYHMGGEKKEYRKFTDKYKDW